MSDQLKEQLAAFDAASTAEEYLDVLEISYDATVVNINRLHILKLFGSDVEQIRDDLGNDVDPGDLLVAYREALEAAYLTFLDSTPLDHRLFKVLQDHAPELDASTFIPLSDLAFGSGASTQPSGGCGCGGSGGGGCS
jgi:hypothetical protein